MQPDDFCTWTPDEIDDYWATSCGNAHTLIDGTPADNNMLFCCYCGRKILAPEQPAEADEEDA